MAKIFFRTTSSLPSTTRLLVSKLSLSPLDLSIWRCCQRRGTPAGSSGSSWAARCPAASAARLEQRSVVAAASGVAWASGGAAGRRAGGAEQAASAHDEHAAGSNIKDGSEREGRGVTVVFSDWWARHGSLGRARCCFSFQVRP
ncbi:hypothetical protein SETIT_7G066500v2 [Setaria italica]|uniref:Uncharacterized protein n=1 Tax=Setaria italica TaxID=4555 RepID=A0A368RUI2_SETIT|nr:hypothetical protein SETIT_7G066500v2 [Setaria italica]